MANGPRDRESVGDELELIEFVTDEGISTARRPEPEAGDKDGPPRRRHLLVLAIAAVVVAIAGVFVVVFREDGDGEAGRGTRDTSNASRTAPDVVPGPTTIPPEERPPATTPGDASTTAPLLPEGAPSTPHIGELVASVTNFDGSAAYYLYADGRLIWWSEQAGVGGGFVEQRLTPEGIERVRSEFLAAALFDPNSPPGNVADCEAVACVRGHDGRLLTARETATESARLVSYLRTLDASLPETEWAAPRIRTYVPARIAVCLQTFVNVPDRVVPVPLDLSILVPAFPARAAELLGGRERIGGRPNPDPACFEVTLDEARTLADEFLSPAGGGSHQYSGLVIRSPLLDAIQPDTPEGIVAYIRFNTLLPHAASAAAFGG